MVEKPKSRQFQAFDGFPASFGATARDGGINFAVFSSNAVSATLCLMNLSDLHEVCCLRKIKVVLNVWHFLDCF